MTSASPDDPTPSAVRRHLEGAYVVQHHANHPGGQGSSLLVRLLLANGREPA